MSKPWLVAIGGSLGSGAALGRILPGLPPGMPASILVATHMAGGSGGRLADMLADKSAWPVLRARHGDPILAGHVHVAVPGHHLMVREGHLVLGTGPQENLSKPAVDPLFRSVAVDAGPRAIGVVLSGLLDDGAAGLHAIRQCGGIGVVQHPVDAEAPGMPHAAMAAGADHVVAAAEIAALLERLTAGEPGPARTPPPGLRLEVRVAEGFDLDSKLLAEIATPVAITCPDCGGVLSQVTETGPLRYRCQVGHALSSETLAQQHHASVWDALRMAIRMMCERLELAERMEWRAQADGRTLTAELYSARKKEYVEHLDALRDALASAIERADKELESHDG